MSEQIVQKHGPRFKDLAGKTFGRLKVLALLECGRRTYWNCVCECGKITSVRSDHLTSGRTVSCGCWSTLSPNKGTHRMSSTPIYKIWEAMRRRCNNPQDEQFHRYGGRGIKVCQSWQESFANFYADMGDIPPKFTIERTNNDGDYEPSNCHWASRKEQARNTRRNHLVTIGNETLPLSEWAERFGLTHKQYQTIHARIMTGWNPEVALKTPRLGGNWKVPISQRQKMAMRSLQR